MHLQVAARPPLGWNSYDCFGSAVTEAEVRANAEFIARHLRVCGWEYVVVDFCWSHPSPGACANPNIGPGCQPLLHTDFNGRLIPAPNRFPSSASGLGFRPLADYVHSLGLKFGVHVMRGIPKQVCWDYWPIAGSSHTTREAMRGDTPECTWLDHMLTVNMQHPAGQAYYDSLFQLYAEWQVDFVKVDDIIADGTDRGLGPYHAAEIEGIRRAIDRCGRPMVLSLSPGDAALTDAGHLQTNANLWRISADFWDDWRKLKRMFSLCEKWWLHRTPGAWPDADMLPLGRICKRGPKMPERDSQLTPAEAKVMLTLWCLFRSPLMIGGHLPETDATTISLLTNPEVLAVNQECLGGQPLRSAAEGTPVWVSDYPGSSDKAVGVFNLRDTACEVAIPLQELGFTSAVSVRDLWAQCTLGRMEEKLRLELPPHSSALWRISRA
jgi:hypothetical protein